jgi:hypothetical protein
VDKLNVLSLQVRGPLQGRGGGRGTFPWDDFEYPILSIYQRPVLIILDLLILDMNTEAIADVSNLNSG